MRAPAADPVFTAVSQKDPGSIAHPLGTWAAKAQRSAPLPCGNGKPEKTRGVVRTDMPRIRCQQSALDEPVAESPAAKDEKEVGISAMFWFVMVLVSEVERLGRAARSFAPSQTAALFHPVSTPNPTVRDRAVRTCRKVAHEATVLSPRSCLMHSTQSVAEINEPPSAATPYRGRNCTLRALRGFGNRGGV